LNLTKNGLGNLWGDIFPKVQPHNVARLNVARLNVARLNVAFLNVARLNVAGQNVAFITCRPSMNVARPNVAVFECRQTKYRRPDLFQSGNPNFNLKKRSW
jgi:hypothetical protein